MKDGRGKTTTHGGSYTYEYTAWCNMKARCTNPNQPDYFRYGGRGISVCSQWSDSFETFLKDLGPRGAGLTLERRRVNGNYEPGNCCWDTKTQQARNRRSNRLLMYRGRTQCVAAWSEELGIKHSTITMRINQYGWSIDRALSTPTRKTKC